MPDRDLDFRVLFESVPGLYLVLDPELRIRAVSNAYLAATLTHRNSILGRGIFEVFPDNPDDPEATGVANLRRSLDRVCATKTPDAMAVQKYDVKIPTEDGSKFEVRYWSPVNSPVLDSAGQLLFIIHRVEDVTDYVHLRMGRAPSRPSAEFEPQFEPNDPEVFIRAQQIQEASSKIAAAHAELGRLYAKSRELDEMKTRFFANASHELRTPLTLILGPLRKQIAELRTAPALVADLEMIERNAALLLTHVNDLLDVSKLEAGQMLLDYRDVNVAAMTRHVISHFESLATEQSINLSCECPDLLVAQVDPEKLQRILFNLVSNAMKFVPAQGSITLSVSSPGDRVIFEVADTGPGVPPEDREAIFERFRQSDHSRGRGGTGLGLAIVKEFAELHLGHVEVRQAPGGGALFLVDLPRHQTKGVNSEPVMPNSSFSELPRIGAPRIGDLSNPVPPAAPESAPLVLIVDDNADMRAFLTQGIAESYRVITAADGQDGLEKAVASRPDLILSDMMMPRLNGEEMAAELRCRVELRDVPIIFLTAMADESLRVRSLHLGAQDFVSKPFTMPELLARIDRRIADRRRVQEQLRQAHRLESVGRLASGVAHDFNNFLTAIIGYGTMIAELPAARNEVEEWSRGILSTAERAAALTRQLLAFARKQSAVPKVFDVNELVRNTLPLLRRLLRDDIELVLELEAESALTSADQGQIEQVVMNLAVNARDAIPGAGKLTLRTENCIRIHPDRQERGEYVALTVSDTGVGMDAYVRGRLFEPFFTTKELGQGTGLGLATSYAPGFT